jgi:hypothetical protein
LRITYRHRVRPAVTVIEPPLELHANSKSLPHVFPGDKLCLHFPMEWNDGMLIACTILPWAAEWLLHYEIWLITEQWEGGGHEPPR